MDGKYIKAAFKLFVGLALIVLIIQAIIFGFYWYQNKNFAATGFNKQEKERCDAVMKSTNPTINDYSYCKSFLEWLDANSKLKH